MIKTLIVLLGDYGSGKTTYARHCAKEYADIAYLDVDLVARTNGAFNYPAFLERVKAIMASSNRETFMLDGAPDTLALSDSLRSDLGCDVRYWVCYAYPSIIRQRQIRKNRACIVSELPHSIEDIERVTYFMAVLATVKDPEAKFIDTSDSKYSCCSYQLWLPCWLGYSFRCRQKRDYQDIEIPYHRIVGHSQSFRTWDRLRAIYDFGGKSVVDYGTNFGYFLFKAEEMGATEMLGIDESSSAIQTAQSVAILRGSKAVFQVGDLRDFTPQKQYDVALCLNVLHHVDNQAGILAKVFTGAHDVIFETPMTLFSQIDNVAREKGFKLGTLVNSHRYARVILRYSTDTQARYTVPAKYVYSWRHYQRQRIRKAVMEVIGSRKLVSVTRLTSKALKRVGLYDMVKRRLS